MKIKQAIAKSFKEFFHDSFVITKSAKKTNTSIFENIEKRHIKSKNLSLNKNIPFTINIFRTKKLKRFVERRNNRKINIQQHEKKTIVKPSK